MSTVLFHDIPKRVQLMTVDAIAQKLENEIDLALCTWYDDQPENRSVEFNKLYDQALIQVFEKMLAMAREQAKDMLKT